MIRLLTLLLIVCSFNAAAAAADQNSPACAITRENAKARLDQAAGDPVRALNDWRAICPNPDMQMFYADEIGKARPKWTPSSSPGGSSSPVAAVTPAPQAEPALTGTFTYSGREDYDDHSGFEEKDDTLTIREDGTAEVKTKYRMVVYAKWYIGGCDEKTQIATAALAQNYTVTRAGDKLTFTRQGPTEIKRSEPSCWNYDLNKYYAESWSLTLRDGRLTNDDGEYKRLP